MAATVPRIDSVSLDTGVGRQRVSADDNAFGAASARAAQSVSAGLGQVARVAAEKDQEFALADAQNMDNALSARVRQRLYDPTTGYLSTARGQNAALRRADIEAGLQQDFAEIDATARNDRARAAYREVAGRRLQGALDQVSTHLANQSREAQTEALNATVTEAVNNAAASWADPRERERQFATIDGAVSQAAELNGWAPVVIEARRREARSNVYSTVLGEMAVTAPQEAEALFTQISPELDEQTRGQLRTTMRVAQREYIDTVEGAAWNAFASGRPLSSMDPQAYQQLTTNPLLGQSYARLTEAYRTRAQSYANGSGRVRDNSPAYIGALLAAQRDQDAFLAPGALETFLAENAANLSSGDMVRLIERRSAMATNGAGDVSVQQSTFNAVRGVAEASLGAYGLNLTPGNARGAERERATADAFDAALMRQVEAFVTNERRQPTPEETQQLIGRAVVGMRDSDLHSLPEFRVRGERGRGRVRTVDGEVVMSANREDDRGSAIAPTTDAVVPYRAIPNTPGNRVRDEIVRQLQSRFGRPPTQGEVELSYAAMLNQ